MTGTTFLQIPSQNPSERQCLSRSPSQRSFYRPGPAHHHALQEIDPGAAINRVYGGISVKKLDDGTCRYCLAFNDGLFLLHYDITDIRTKRTRDDSSEDSFVSRSESGSGSGTLTPIELTELPMVLQDQIIDMISEYRMRKLCKPMGIGITEDLAKLCPRIMVEIWNKLDAVPFVFSPRSDMSREFTGLTSDEEAESMAREAVKQFQGSNVSVTHGHKRKVEVDSAGRARIADLETYHQFVNMNTTWPATLKYAEELKRKKIKIAFFNTTPQGGGVALMRHALVRFLSLLGVDCTWYNPVIRPEAVRATKDNHNILQGVAVSGERLTKEKITLLNTWVKDNVGRYGWSTEGGPLAPRARGGADIIVVDDPQMPSLVKIAKEQDPQRNVIFRSHIQIRGDLVDQGNTTAAEVWKWVWDNVQECDVFVSHPVSSFVPKNVPSEKVGYLPASTDWFDGLNKDMDSWDEQYFIHECKSLCFHNGMRQLAFPKRDYIVQIARFDPAKGIPDLIQSYNELRKTYLKDETDITKIPQLVIAGHTAADDPDVTRIFDDTEQRIKQLEPEIARDIIVMRIGPSDQMLNALMSCSLIALQLSTREGFEVKVSEAIHKGKPIIATKAGGIPLQVVHGQSGFLVEPGDYKAVAKHLYHLLTDDALYTRMSQYAATHVSDEVGTVGNALAWLYLAEALSSGRTVKPNGRWINDMAREEAGFPYLEGEPRLPRNV